MTSDYERGFKDGVEAAAKEAEGYAVQKQTQHLHPTAYALREVATRVRSLDPSPEKAQEPSRCSAEGHLTYGVDYFHAVAAPTPTQPRTYAEAPPQPAPTQVVGHLDNGGEVRTGFGGDVSLCAVEGDHPAAPPQPAPPECRKVCPTAASATCHLPTGHTGEHSYSISEQPAPLPEEGVCQECGGDGRMFRNCAVPKCKGCGGSGKSPVCQECGGVGRRIVLVDENGEVGNFRPCPGCDGTGRKK